MLNIARMIVQKISKRTEKKTKSFSERTMKNEEKNNV